MSAVSVVDTLPDLDRPESATHRGITHTRSMVRRLTDAELRAMYEYTLGVSAGVLQEIADRRAEAAEASTT